MAIVSSETVDRVVKGGHQVRRLTGGGAPGSATEEVTADRWTRVRQDTDQSGGLVTKTVTPMSSGTGVPPAGADRAEVEHYGQKRGR